MANDPTEEDPPLTRTVVEGEPFSASSRLL
jgi:hypothetical protein